jgi:hypothetical protein
MHPEGKNESLFTGFPILAICEKCPVKFCQQCCPATHVFVQPFLTYAAERSASWQQQRSITSFFMSNILATQCIYYSFLVYCLLN